MIKFKELLHIETNTTISYNEWLQHLTDNRVMVFAVTEQSSWRYNPRNMLLTDEFEIIYESDFNIICPYCGHKHDGLDYVETGDMEGEFPLNCEGCEKAFRVEFTTIITFKTEKIE